MTRRSSSGIRLKRWCIRWCEAILLVVIVVIIFLQTWRAAIIPLAAVPVSLVGTLTVMLMLGFSINALSLFGLVLAIGIVVDDAIVVVENVERNIANGLSAFAAAKRAMDEVTGPIVATALVLCAVFIPTAFISGLTGQFYKQFAHHDCDFHGHFRVQFADALAGVVRGVAEGSSRAERLAVAGDGQGVRLVFQSVQPGVRLGRCQIQRWGSVRVLRKSAIALVVYGGLVLLTAWGFDKVPTGFVPTQDKQYLVAFAQLPDGCVAGPHRGGHPPHVGHRPEAARGGGGGGVSRIEHQRVQRGAQFRHCFLHLETV